MSVLELLLRLSRVTDRGRFKGSKSNQDKLEVAFDARISSLLEAWYTKLLERELLELCRDETTRMPAIELTPEKAASFDLREINHIHEAKAPMLHRLVGVLCNVRPVNKANEPRNGEVGSLGLESTNADDMVSATDIAPDLDNMERGNGYEWVAALFREEDELGDDDEEDRGDPMFVGGVETHGESLGVASGAPGAQLSGEESRIKTGKGRGNGLRVVPGTRRNKRLMAGAVIRQMMFARTNRANAFQTVMGYYLSATGTSRNTISVMNQCGVSIAYTTINKANKACARAAMKQLRKDVARGMTFGGFWDNMVIALKVAEETTVNYSTMLNWTARGVWKVEAPCEVPLKWEVENGIMFRQRQGNSEMELAQDGSMACLPRDTLLGKTSYKDLTLVEVLCPKRSAKYYEQMSKGSVSETLAGVIGKKGVPIGSRYRKPEVYYAAVKRSDIRSLRTLALNESKLKDNGELLEALPADFGLRLSDMLGRATFTAGDLMTLLRIKGVQWMRFRDLPQYQMGWAVNINGMLHVGIAAAEAVVFCNLGRKDGRDPCSLARIIQILGRTRIIDSKNIKDYSAAHRLLMQVKEACVLNAAMEISKAKNREELRKYCEDCD